jgi:hypothetical protein
MCNKKKGCLTFFDLNSSTARPPESLKTLGEPHRGIAMRVAIRCGNASMRAFYRARLQGLLYAVTVILGTHQQIEYRQNMPAIFHHAGEHVS